MKTFIANETLLLIDGEIMVVETYCKKGDILIDTHSNTIYIANADSDCLVKYIYKLLASTKQLPNVKQLPREMFVKRVDVFNAYEQAKDNIGYNNYDNQFEYFQAGYNANKNEFTKEDMKECWIQSTRKSVDFNGEAGFTKFIDNIKPLTLPKSITTNDELEIIEILW